MRNLIFDFDGTIADSFETFLEIFEEITDRTQKLNASEIKDLRGKTVKEIIKYLKIKNWQIPRLIFKAKKLSAIKITHVKTFAGMPPILKQLQQGNRLFILTTNSPENVTQFLVTNGLGGCFDDIYGDIGLRSKASALKKIIRKQKIKTQDCCYIGDEVRDIAAAKKAGITSVAVGWGFNLPEAIKSAAPDAYAAQPQDLLTILAD